MTDDALDLPARPSSLQMQTKSGNRLSLNESQFNEAMKKATEIASGFQDVARHVLEIARLRATSKSISDVLKAKGEAALAEAKADVERMRQQGILVHNRGAEIARILDHISECIAQIPEFDSGSREALIQQIGPIVSEICRDK